MYPFEYIDSFKKFSEKIFPYKCEFYSSLKEEWIEADHLYAINVWNTFKIKHNECLSWPLFTNRRFVIGWYFWKGY